MTPFDVGVIGYNRIGQRIADAIQRQSDLRLSGVYETAPQRTQVAKSRKLTLVTTGVAEWAARCSAVVVCEDHGLTLSTRLIDSAGLSGGSLFSAPFGTPRDSSHVHVACADALAFGRMLKFLPGVERLFSSCARRSNRTGHPSTAIDSMEPIFQLPSEDADIRNYLRPLGCEVSIRRTLLPYSHSHLHHLRFDFSQATSRESVLETLLRAPRLRLARAADGFPDTGHLQEYDRDLGRPWGDRPEVFVWEESIEVIGRSLYLTADVNPDATVIPDTIDAVRSLVRPDLTLAEVSRLTDEFLSSGGRD